MIHMNPLVGKYFIVFDSEGKLHGRGKIKAMINSRWYFIEDIGIIHSRLCIVTIEDMKKWHFFTTKESWKEEMENL